MFHNLVNHKFSQQKVRNLLTHNWCIKHGVKFACAASDVTHRAYIQ